MKKPPSALCRQRRLSEQLEFPQGTEPILLPSIKNIIKLSILIHLFTSNVNEENPEGKSKDTATYARRNVDRKQAVLARQYCKAINLRRSHSVADSVYLSDITSTEVVR
jgi:hypothetical protein